MLFPKVWVLWKFGISLLQGQLWVAAPFFVRAIAGFKFFMFLIHIC